MNSIGFGREDTVSILKYSGNLFQLFGDSDVLGLSGLPTDQQSLDINKKG